MKIPALVVITTSFPIAGDGSEAAGSFVADLVDELAKGVRVRVVAPGRTEVREELANGVEIFRYAAPSRALSTLKPWRLQDLKWIARVLWGGKAATHRAADGTNHILALWGLPCGEWARQSARERGIGYSTWMLGSDVWSLGRIPFLRGLLARVIRHAQHAYADGYMLAEEAQRIAGTSVEFLPSTRRIGIDDPPPPRDAAPYRLLFLGRWHPNKGVDLLIDALALLGDDDWKRIERVDIQGGGPLELLVRERVGVLQRLGRPVEVGKFLDKDEAEDAIVRSDWLLIPSRIESIPVVFSDAMKLGRPVITMPVGDLPRLVGTSCGVVSRVVNTNGFSEAIKDAIWAKEVPDPRAIRAQAREFSCSAIAAKIIADCLGGGGHA